MCMRIWVKMIASCFQYHAILRLFSISLCYFFLGYDRPLSIMPFMGSGKVIQFQTKAFDSDYSIVFSLKVSSQRSLTSYSHQSQQLLNINSPRPSDVYVGGLVDLPPSNHEIIQTLYRIIRHIAKWLSYFVESICKDNNIWSNDTDMDGLCNNCFDIQG